MLNCHYVEYSSSLSSITYTKEDTILMVKQFDFLRKEKYERLLFSDSQSVFLMLLSQWWKMKKYPLGLVNFFIIVCLIVFRVWIPFLFWCWTATSAHISEFFSLSNFSWKCKITYKLQWVSLRHNLCVK